MIMSNFVNNYVNEKGNKIKETLKIMGLKTSAYELSWWTVIYFKAGVIFCMMVIFMLILNDFENCVANWYEIIGLNVFFYAAIIS